MVDPSSASADGHDEGDADGDAAAADDDVEALRERVEAKYDFEDFGPDDMAEMTLDEWEAAFDSDTWIVGQELLDRVERDLERRIAERDVFAVVERTTEGGEPRLLAYSDEGYAVVHPDGSIEGRGTVGRDVKPTVALCSMESYEVEDPPADFELPEPDDVIEGTGEFGNHLLQAVAAVQIVAGLVLLAAWGATLVTTIVAPVAALMFLLIGVFLFGVVANARLSDRFRAEEYRNRLRAVGVEEGDRPEFVPEMDDAPAVEDGADAEGDDAG